jgi:hypothetical protein
MTTAAEPVHLSPRYVVSFSVHPTIVIADAYDRVEQRGLVARDGRTVDEALSRVRAALRSMRAGLLLADLEGA